MSQGDIQDRRKPMRGRGRDRGPGIYQSKSRVQTHQEWDRQQFGGHRYTEDKQERPRQDHYTIEYDERGARPKEYRSRNDYSPQDRR